MHALCLKFLRRFQMVERYIPRFPGEHVDILIHMPPRNGGVAYDSKRAQKRTLVRDSLAQIRPTFWRLERCWQELYQVRKKQRQIHAGLH